MTHPWMSVRDVTCHDVQSRCPIQEWITYLWCLSPRCWIFKIWYDVIHSWIGHRDSFLNSGMNHVISYFPQVHMWRHHSRRTCLELWHDSFLNWCEGCDIQESVTSYHNISEGRDIQEWVMSYHCPICDTTHGGHASSCDTTHSWMHVTSLTDVCLVAHSYVSQDSFICVTWLIHTCSTSWWHVMCVCVCVCVCMCVCLCVCLCVCVCVCVRVCVWHTSWWHASSCDMTHSWVSHLSTNHATRINKLRDTYEWAMGHIHTHERVMGHVAHDSAPGARNKSATTREWGAITTEC